MEHFPLWLQSLSWGFIAGSSLIMGSILGYYLPLSHRLNAIVMAFGAGTLFSAMAIELIPEASRRGGPLYTAAGLLVGGFFFTWANILLRTKGAINRKRSTGGQLSEKDQAGSGKALALGAALDGVPESMVLGMSFISGGKINVITLMAIFISNLPEGLSSSVGMKERGRSKRYIFGLWLGITFLSGISTLLGFELFHFLSPQAISFITAIAAGAIMTMIVDTMIPEAYAGVSTLAGIATLFGFLTAFLMKTL